MYNIVMLTINGKILVTTDWHFGVNQNRTSKLKIMMNVVKGLNSYIKKNKIESLIFGGDIFHQRNNLSIETINVAISSIETLAKNCEIYLILGNHDMFNKNTTWINSMKIFKHIPHVHIIEEPTECSINGEKCLFLPWCSDLSKFEKNSYSMLFGHFDISEKYIIASFIEENIKNNHLTYENIQKLNCDELLVQSGFEDFQFITKNEIETLVDSKKSSDLIGDWIEIVKEKGTIFSGHIHNHKEFYSKNRKFIFIGSPYQQTLGEINSIDGFYIIDEKNKHKFHKLEGIPIHVNLKISEIEKNIDNFDYSIVKGNIIHKIYDKEIDSVLDAKITSKILSYEPYEELQPDYSVKSNSTENEISDDSIDIIRRSKLEYLQNYINNIDEKILTDKNINRDKLFKVMTEYYNIVNEGDIK